MTIEEVIGQLGYAIITHDEPAKIGQVFKNWIVRAPGGHTDHYVHPVVVIAEATWEEFLQQCDLMWPGYTGPLRNLGYCYRVMTD